MNWLGFLAGIGTGLVLGGIALWLILVTGGGIHRGEK